MRAKTRVGRGLALAALFLTGLLAGCGAEPAQHAANPAVMAPYLTPHPASGFRFPAFVSSEVLPYYQFAVEHPDVLRWLPCYCGCGLTAGHRSNLDCFVAGTDANGAPIFDEHGSFCQTCVDIARDAQQLAQKRTPIQDIRTYVDARHSAKGPGTETPMPPPVPTGTGS